MDKNPAKKPETLRKQITVALTYQIVAIGDEIAALSLNRAFDILFEEVLRRRKGERQICAKIAIDNCEQLGVSYTYGVFHKK